MCAFPPKALGTAAAPDTATSNARREMEQSPLRTRMRREGTRLRCGGARLLMLPLKIKSMFMAGSSSQLLHLRDGNVTLCYWGNANRAKRIVLFDTAVAGVFILEEYPR